MAARAQAEALLVLTGGGLAVEVVPHDITVTASLAPRSVSAGLLPRGLVASLAQRNVSATLEMPTRTAEVAARRWTASLEESWQV